MQELAPKVDKTQKIINIFLCILPALALLTILFYCGSQKSVATQVTTAIKFGDNETAIELIEQIESMQQTDNDRETILMVACESGNAEIIELALNKGAKPNYCPSGALTPLELYCLYGYHAGQDTLYTLLKLGANPIRYEQTPPLYCLTDKLQWTQPDEREVIEEEIILLLKAGSPLTYNDTSILHYAAQYNLGSVAEYLVHTVEGAKLLAMKDENGKTPYEVAISHGAASVQRAIRHFEEELKAELEENETPIEDSIEVEEIPSLDELIESLMGQYQEMQNTAENID